VENKQSFFVFIAKVTKKVYHIDKYIVKMRWII